MLDAARKHWPEYLMEAAELGAFMISACLVVALLEHPGSAVSRMLPDSTLRRVLAGIAMGLTAIAIVYSPWGKQSGAHFNPSVTLTFLRLGKIAPWDALFYAVAQFAGAALGMIVASLLLGDWLGHPSVDFVATRPGASGATGAMLAEIAISFLMMSMILAVSSAQHLARYTGLFAGMAVATFISVEAPLSGMSMNPARSTAPALMGWLWDFLWIYFLAPPLGMLLAAEVHVRLRGRSSVHCAKLHHANSRRCIFCGDPGKRAEGRAVSRRIAAALALLLVASASASDAATIRAVDSIGLTVSDADRAATFFTDVLTFEKVSDVEVQGDGYEQLTGLAGLRTRMVRMRLGDESIDLIEVLSPRGRPIPPDSRSNDRWFQHVAIVVSDMARAYERLRAHRVQHSSPSPQTLPDWNPDAAGIRAFYFKDPDGHPLEIIQFPRGKGDPRWQRPTHDLFLGIDHTAIVVGDTEASLDFYRDALGLEVAGGSENHGIEQERLNDVRGAHLRITTLRAPAGPGIELLEYLAPRDGRPIPPDQRAGDLAHWQTRLLAADLASAERALRAARAASVSTGPALGVTVKDPDGHALILVE